MLDPAGLAQENQELRKALAAARSEDAREARVIDVLERSIKVVKPGYRAKATPGRTSQRPHVLVLLFSDAHAGETISRIETNGLNEYNWRIMLRRLQKLAQGVRSHRDHYGIQARELHILSAGDGLSGSIHEELRETNDTAFAEATVRFGEDVATWIAREFGGEFERIRMDCVVGNHPRLTLKPRAKLAYDNGDYIASHVTRLALAKHKHVTVNVPKAAQTLVDICGRKNLLIHGDGVRTTMAGVPWAGIIRHADQLRRQYGRIDHIFTGHWHKAQVAEDRSIVINGSLCGVDEYALRRYGGGRPPCQLLAAFHPKHGMTGVHFVDCDA